MNYHAAFLRPFQDGKKLTIGALLNGLPIINILTGFFVYGYTAECARLTLHRKNTLPVWQNWSGLFKRGILLGLIWVVYSIPLLLVFLILLLQGAKKFLALADPSFGLKHLLQQNWGYTALLILLFLLTWYYTLYAALHYVEHYRFRDSFQFHEVFTRANHHTYLKAWFTSFVYTLLVGLLLQAILLTVQDGNLFLGIAYNLFSGYLTFAVSVTTMTLSAEAYRETLRI